jgi:hypothetical protein
VTGSGEARARTIYIASLGRSGSTALASCLGAPDGSVAIGEAYYLWSRGLSGRSRCGCLRAVTDCPFWRPILEEVRRSLGAGSLDDLAERAEHAPRLRHLRRLLRHPELVERDHGAYLELRLALHRALLEAGHHTIVDSSKRPVELLVLSRIPEIADDLTVVHLVRHPGRTAASWARPKPDASRVEGALTPIGRTTSLAWWYWWNRSTRAVGATLPDPPIRLNWEDVTADPGPALARILGSEARDAVLVGPNRIRVDPSHQVDGNPVKLDDAAGMIELRPDGAPTRLAAGHALLLRREMARVGYRGAGRC